MSKLALGIIETVGLAAAIEAADTAVKSANIRLLGYELSKGGGLVTIKIEGNVGAVKAAVRAGCIAAQKVSKVWSKQVIPRPHVELEKLIVTEETVGILKKSEENKLQNIEEIQESKSKLVEKIEVVGSQDESENIEKQYKNQREICNLCGDPLCPRKKGEPRKLCINYKKEKKEE